MVNFVGTQPLYQRHNLITIKHYLTYIIIKHFKINTKIQYVGGGGTYPLTP